MATQGEADRGAEVNTTPIGRLAFPGGAMPWRTEAVKSGMTDSKKKEAGPSSIRASRVWAQDDNERQGFKNKPRLKA